MKSKTLAILLILSDWLFSILTWAIFFYFRKVYIEETDFLITDRFYLGIAVIPIIWLTVFMLQGTYHNVKRLYRLKVLNLSLFGALLSSVLVFFVFLLDDDVNSYKNYYYSFSVLFGLLFFLVTIPRMILVNRVVRSIHRRRTGFKTLLIGGSAKAVEVYNEIQGLPRGTGHDIVGFVNINGVDKELSDCVEYLGHLDDIEIVLRKYNIEEVIIALETVEHDKLRSIISRLEGGDLVINVIPDMYDILSGSVHMSNIYGALLLKVNSEVIPVWQVVLKRVFDIVTSFIAIILLLPVYLVLSIIVKFSSPGPIFFLQDRVGKNGRIFKIIKFRTMFVDAEKNGPQLSSSNDPRITSVGRFMRKSRLDEFPQFFNVIIGDMSIVGPRPERQFYIDQIASIEPQFLELTKVRPGITSWGQVKYGYAENVDQMLDRMKYDLLYLRNRSFALDLKIIIYTVMIVFKGEGK